MVGKFFKFPHWFLHCTFMRIVICQFQGNISQGWIMSNMICLNFKVWTNFGFSVRMRIMISEVERTSQIIQEGFMSNMIIHNSENCAIFCLCVWELWSINFENESLWSSSRLSYDYHDHDYYSGIEWNSWAPWYNISWKT